MGMRKTILKTAAQQHIQPCNAAFMFDEQGKEIQITTAMIQQTCKNLLLQCRRIKH
jgi:hypothetical protein